MEKEVSIVTSVHDEEKFVSQCIESVLNQTIENFEFLIIDDASTDNTFNILKEFENKDTRIKVFKNEKQLGPYISANKLLKKSIGKYKARIDGDDAWLNSKLKNQIKFMKEENLSFSCTHVQCIDENNNNLHVHATPSKKQLKWSLNFENHIRHSSVMWSGSFLYDEDFIFSSDYELFTRIRKNFQIDTLKEVITLYRNHPNSITNSQTQKQLALAKIIIKRELEFYLNKNLTYERVGELENIYRHGQKTKDEDFLKLQKIFDIEI